jgi:hypothetical protein
VVWVSVAVLALCTLQLELAGVIKEAAELAGAIPEYIYYFSTINLEALAIRNICVDLPGIFSVLQPLCCLAGGTTNARECTVL